MKRLQSMLGVLGVGFGVFGSACMVDQAEPNRGEIGSLSVALIAQANGTTYRLRNAVFEVTGPSPVRLESEADPNSLELTGVVLTGNYNVELLDGWAMERLDAMGSPTPVQATVLDTSVFVQVVAGSISNARFRFETEGRVVDNTLGDIRVTFEINELPGPVMCDPLDPAACPAGEGCSVTTNGVECVPTTVPGNNGDVCTAQPECSPGLACAALPTGTGACTPFCDANMPATCPSGTICTVIGLPTAPDVSICVVQ